MMLRLPNNWRTGSVPAPVVPWLGSDGPRDRRDPAGFRLVQPSLKIAPAVTGDRMSRQFTAIILLDEHWDLDVPAVAATVAARFPTIGRIETRPAASTEFAGAVTIDGARVTLQQLPGRVTLDRLTPPLTTLRAWDSDNAIRHHAGAIEISCGGELPGLEGAEAYAAAVHFVTTAATRVAPASAVFWCDGWAITQPDVFGECAERILEGRMPLPAWVSFATIVPKGFAPEKATGMVTYGMRPFIGRELELAPRPGSARDAYHCISRIARMVLDRGISLQDGQQLADSKGAFAVTVRERSFWLRQDQAAYVLVPDDAVVDVETLRPRSEVA